MCSFFLQRHNETLNGVQEEIESVLELSLASGIAGAEARARFLAFFELDNPSEAAVGDIFFEADNLYIFILFFFLS